MYMLVTEKMVRNMERVHIGEWKDNECLNTKI